MSEFILLGAVVQAASPWDAWTRSVVILVLAAGAGFVLHRLLRAGWDRRLSTTEPTEGEAVLLRHCSRPAAWAIPLFTVHLALPLALPTPTAGAFLGRFFSIALIVMIAWFAVALVRAGEEIIRGRFRVDVSDNLRARAVHTQTEVVRKILVVVIAIVAFAGILMTFEPLRELGTGLLASAGLAGLILGLAAQRTLGNLLAGIQIAWTQPIRLDDVVIVEGEWGWIEEITLTYVVVRIWDLRRMVLPISWFIENPFQNWTRTSANILGTVFLYADYTIPVGEVRAELERVLRDSPHWDGEVWRLHVTQAGEQTVELRCLMSAADSSTAWELRCEVREKLLEWFQRKHPDALPRVRAELEPLSSDEEIGDSASLDEAPRPRGD